MAERRSMLSAKMAHAEAKRQEHIDGIRRKAREEDAKLKEIAFINELQAQNTRIDMLAQNAENDEKVGGKGLRECQYPPPHTCPWASARSSSNGTGSESLNLRYWARVP